MAELVPLALAPPKRFCRAPPEADPMEPPPPPPPISAMSLAFWAAAAASLLYSPPSPKTYKMKVNLATVPVPVRGWGRNIEIGLDDLPS